MRNIKEDAVIYGTQRGAIGSLLILPEKIYRVL